MSTELFRLDRDACRELLERRLAEPAPGRIQLLAGPRQVGKTTLLLEIAGTLGGAAIYAAADGPEASLPGFWERLWQRARDVAEKSGRAVLLLDEVHVLSNWAARLKAEWDRARRLGLPLHVIATGSSSLRLGSGSRESLAGRFERIVLAHWSAASLARTFGIGVEEAPSLAVRIGTYPGAMALRDDIPRLRAYVRDAIVEPAIGRDILALAPVRRPALLRQVFAVAAGSPAQVVSLQKIQGQLQDAGALETIAHYLSLLEEAFLVAALEKHSPRAVRRRAAPPKLVVLNNALLAAADPRGIPTKEAEPARFGAWVENACLACAWNAGQRVTYWREEPLEVDGVIEGSWGSWAVEVKTGPVLTGDLRGLLELTRRFPDLRPLLVGDDAGRDAAERAGIGFVTWRDFLLHGPTPPSRSTRARRDRPFA